MPSSSPSTRAPPAPPRCDRPGRSVLGRGYREFTQHFPRPGWVEHDPEEICASRSRRMREALAGRGRAPGGIGITNQRETVVLWDRAHRPRRSPRPSSGRTAAPATAAASSRDAAPSRCSRERTGLVADPYFSATKLEWLLRDPELRRAGRRGRARRRHGGELAGGAADRRPRPRHRSHQCLPHAALQPRRARLGPGAARRCSASPRACCPDRAPVGERVGAIERRASRRTPADRRAWRATSRPRCSARAAARDGTGEEHLRHRGVPAGAHRRRRRCRRTACSTTAACGPRGGPAYALEGSVFIAGAAVQWLRDGLGLIRDAAERRRSRAACPTPAGCISFRHSSAWARRTGSRMRAGRSSASPAAPPVRTGARRARGDGVRQRRGARGDGRRERAATCPRCGWTAARRPTTG